MVSSLSSQDLDINYHPSTQDHNIFKNKSNRVDLIYQRSEKCNKSSRRQECKLESLLNDYPGTLNLSDLLTPFKSYHKLIICKIKTKFGMISSIK